MANTTTVNIMGLRKYRHPVLNVSLAPGEVTSIDLADYPHKQREEAQELCEEIIAAEYFGREATKDEANASGTPPSRTGKGSGAGVWKAWLESNSVEIPDGAKTREALIAVWDEHTG